MLLGVLGVTAYVMAIGVAFALWWHGASQLGGTLLLAAIGSLMLAGLAQRAHARGRIRHLEHELLDKTGYKLFVDHATEGFFRARANGAILEANAALAHIYGYNTPEELRAELNENPRRLYFDPSRREEFASQMRAQGSVKEFISKIRRRDGKAIWVTENARAVYDSTDSLLFYEGTVQDITVQRETLQAMQRTLQESQEAARAKSAFIAAMSHELKTPLNAVLGFSELMQQQLFGPIDARYRSYVGDIHTNGKKLLSLITDVLDFARIEGGALELSESVFSLGDIIESAREAALQSRPDHAPIAIALPSVLPLLRGDPKRVLQILASLLSNAVKFTPADGHIQVKAYHGADGSLLVEVADSGIGMAPGQIAIALEPFKQIDGRLAAPL